MEHSPTSATATAWERAPKRAAQPTALEARCLRGTRLRLDDLVVRAAVLVRVAAFG